MVLQLIELALIFALILWGLWRMPLGRAGYLLYVVIAFLAILRVAGLVAALSMAAALAGCSSAPRTSSSPGVPSSLLAQARPIGRGPRFHPPVTGSVAGHCLRRLGSRIGVHVELFAADRVVLVPAGIGTRPPRVLLAGRISMAGCYGELVTLDPTGLVLVRPGHRLTVGELFRAWGQPLRRARLGPFRAPKGKRVTVFVDGHPWRGSPRHVPLAAHAEIVLEVGPHVPPHASYTFPPGT